MTSSFLSHLALPLLLLATACPPTKPADTGTPPVGDEDGDGYTVDEGDCDDADASVFPGAAETWYDGVDQDCQGDTDDDADGDGYAVDADCWDDPARPPDGFTVVQGADATGRTLSWDALEASEVHPEARDTWYDGVDADCAGNDDFDQDGDGYQTDDYPHPVASGNPAFGDDCIDDPTIGIGLDEPNPADTDAASVHPGAAETWYDGTDQDCDANDCDADGDGHAYPGSVYCDAEDCDDANPTAWYDPSVPEVWYNGVDENCDANDGDQDGDGWWVADYDDRVAAAGGTPLAIPDGATGDCWDDPAEADDHAPLNGFPLLDPAAVNPGASDTWYDGIDQDCDGADDLDQDTDGWTAAGYETRDGRVGDDCADADPAVNPGAVETCDGVDQDCDGVADDGAEGAAAWYADADADGFGDGASGVWSCTNPTGYVLDATDCDDTRADVNPAATETCDDADVDEDCDGTADGSDPEGAAGTTLYYPDADGDGWGEEYAAGILLCDPDPSWPVTDATDCDDTVAGVHPGAPEVCDPNDVDEDCNGLEDGDDPGLTDAPTWYPDADGDGWGDAASAGLTACEPTSGFSTADHTDCDDAAFDVNPEALEVCDGVDQDCDGSVDEDATEPATWCQDLDGDGYGDPSATTLTCTAPSGFVADCTDCDDSTAAVNPAADESCNAVDDDCDGVVDGGSAMDPIAWYYDQDGDGYGNAAIDVLSCTRPTGYVSAATDCNDEDAAIHPGMTEACDDADVDEDCDGAADDADAGPVAGRVTRWPDADGDGYGDALVEGTPACEPVTGWTTDATDCDDAAASTHPMASEVCDGADNDCDDATDEDGAVGGATWYADADTDGWGDPAATTEACTVPEGYVGDATDCDDTSALVFPGAPESCNGVDDDCDGTPDEEGATGGPTWYQDADGDGWGDPDTSTSACTAPAGFVADDTDCDDTRAAVHPEAEEVCDAEDLDEDCDGAADDADTVVTAPTWYADDDGDGYGSALYPLTACEQPVGYAASDADCDDTSALVFPGAPETCNGTDDDCDGAVDETGATGGGTWYRDADADGYGDPLDPVAACTVPSGYVGDGTDCDDGDASVHPGAEEVCDAADSDEDCDGLADDADTGATGTTRYYPDVDGDGWGDATSAGHASCDPSGAWEVTDALDCDDARADVNPAGVEFCDAADADEDCDGLADDADASPVGTTDFYPDADGDGWGDAASAPAALCDATSAWPTPDDTDCDDADAAFHPGATDVCGDGEDQDCSGADEVCPGPSPSWCVVQWPKATTACAGVDTETIYGRVYDEDFTPGAGPADGLSAEVGWGPAGTTPDDVAWTWTEGTYNTDYGNDDEWMGTLNVPTEGDWAFAFRFSGNEGTTWLLCDAVGSGPTDLYDPADEAVLTVLGDADDDGWLVAACGGTDCDDTDAGVNPGVVEACDAADLDEDCDGLADDDDSFATGTATFYWDGDGDGDGDPSVTGTSLCDASGTWRAATATDCDDTDALEYGGGTEADDGHDNDCDDMVDEGFRTAGDLVITEIMYNPSGSEPGTEWIEVTNPTARDLPLDGWLLYTSGSSGKSFFLAPDGLEVPAGGTAVLCYADTTLPGLCDYVYGSDVNAASDLGPTYNTAFQLTNGTSGYSVRFTLDGTTIDSVTYNSSASGTWPTSTNGYSIELSTAHTNATDNGTAAWWCLASSSSLFWSSGTTVKDYGTPNAPNVCATP